MRTLGRVAFFTLLILLPTLAFAADATVRSSPRNDSVVFEELAHVRRAEAIEQLEYTLATHGARMERELVAEALFRLGDLRWEHSRAELDRAIRDLDARYDGWSPEDGTPEPRLDDTVVRAWTESAAERWRELVRRFPDHRRAPEAHFFLAMALDELGDADRARQLREQFVVSWPAHAFVGEAYTGLGEYWFERSNPYKALPAYQRAAEITSSRTYPLALYRIGWCHKQMGDLEAAEQAFVGLLQEARYRRREGTEGSAILLEEETLRVLASVYADLGDVARAEAVFCGMAPVECRRLLGRMAEGFVERGRVEGAIDVWRDLIQRDPLAKDNPQFQGRIVSTLWSMQRFEEAATETDRLATRFGDGSRWSLSNPDGAAGEAAHLIEERLRKVALGTHREAVQQRSSELLVLAERCYERYLELYANDDGAYEVRYWYAEALFALRKYDRAADEYDRVVRSNPEGRWVREAAAGSIFSIEKHLEELGIMDGSY